MNNSTIEEIMDRMENMQAEAQQQRNEAFYRSEMWEDKPMAWTSGRRAFYNRWRSRFGVDFEFAQRESHAFLGDAYAIILTSILPAKEFARAFSDMGWFNEKLGEFMDKYPGTKDMANKVIDSALLMLNDAKVNEPSEEAPASVGSVSGNGQCP